MSASERVAAKQVIAPFRSALYDFDPDDLRRALESVFAPDAVVRLAYPFETLEGPQSLVDKALSPLSDALPDLERRDAIVMAGRSTGGELWVGCRG
ncbi:MAG TPA: polyketide cyclase, partial [Parvularcula sp.]|nr:polyketide cyclase [Parvularcula sp.]